MNTQTNNSKNTLSSQVKQILSEKGYSFLFNWSDYHHFKDQAKTAFNKAFSIAEMFIEESTQKSDFNEYIF
jgi:predicted transcriptional regulator